MKTTFLRAIVCVTLVFTGVLNADLKAQDKFVTNDVMIGEQITSKIIYRHDGMLYRHMKHNFIYDDQNRVVGKETFKWDSRKNDWVPYCTVNLTYTTDQVIMNYAKWNAKNKAYNKAQEKNIYELDAFDAPVAYQNYKQNTRSGDWEIIKDLRFASVGVLHANNR